MAHVQDLWRVTYPGRRRRRSKDFTTETAARSFLRTVEGGRIERLYKPRYRKGGKEYSGTPRARKKDAQDFLDEQGEKIRGGEWVDPALGRVTFAERAKGWSAARVGLKAKTRAGDDSLLRTHVLPEFGELPCNRIERSQGREWIARLQAQGLSASRIRQAYFVVNMILDEAVEDRALARNPLRGLDLPRIPRREMRFLSSEEVGRLAESVPDLYRPLIFVLAYGGVRVGEALALRRKRCDLLRSRLVIAESLADVNGTLHFGATKTHQVRTVRLPGFLRDLLAEHLAGNVANDPEALVFTSTEGAPIRLSNWRRRVWERALQRAGLPSDLRIHDLRHTAAALLIHQGAHPKQIQAHLGHASITTTLDRYGHLFDDDMDRLADGLEATYQAAKSADWIRTGNGSEVPQLAERRAENRV